MAKDVKQADLAGKWYPESGDELNNLINSCLASVPYRQIEGKTFAIISPHAGYRFSGPVAAYGYKAVSKNTDIKTVIIIGFSHRQMFDGVSVYEKGSFSTPLGDIGIDSTLAKAIIKNNKRIAFNPDLFRDENSVEMQIPFIQASLGNASIVPIAFGTQDLGDAEILADALAAALRGRDDVLIIASTDMSHYHPYADANIMDKHTIDIVKGMNGAELYRYAIQGTCEMCGSMPVTATLLAAKKLGYDDIEILKYANSGDTYGDKSKVVGYMSAVIYRGTGGGDKKRAATSEKRWTMDDGRETTENDGLLNGAQRKRLLQIARESMAAYVKDNRRTSFEEIDLTLSEPMGAFVTLRQNGSLRGCIGSIVGNGPLYQTIADMAIEASTGDPRFPRLMPEDLNKVDIEISVLSPLKKISGSDEIRIPGHGVLVKRGFRSGVYLPQVATENGWTKDEFMLSLCRDKAGLSPDAWKDPGAEVYIFTAEVFGEEKK